MPQIILHLSVRLTSCPFLSQWRSQDVAGFEAGGEGGWSSLSAFPFHASLFSIRLSLSKFKRQEGPAGQDTGRPQARVPTCISALVQRGGRSRWMCHSKRTIGNRLLVTTSLRENRDSPGFFLIWSCEEKWGSRLHLVRMAVTEWGSKGHSQGWTKGEKSGLT